MHAARHFAKDPVFGVKRSLTALGSDAAAAAIGGLNHRGLVCGISPRFRPSSELLDLAVASFSASFVLIWHLSPTNPAIKSRVKSTYVI